MFGATARGETRLCFTEILGVCCEILPSVLSYSKQSGLAAIELRNEDNGTAGGWENQLRDRECEYRIIIFPALAASVLQTS
jgi:hypothetical protein